MSSLMFQVLSVIEQIEMVEVGASLHTYAMISLTAGGMT